MEPGTLGAAAGDAVGLGCGVGALAPSGHSSSSSAHDALPLGSSLLGITLVNVLNALFLMEFGSAWPARLPGERTYFPD